MAIKDSIQHNKLEILMISNIKKDTIMSKNSKSCGYTGHMRILDRGVNQTKENFDAGRDKSHLQFEHGPQAKHEKKGSGIVYPEAACTCKK